VEDSINLILGEIQTIKILLITMIGLFSIIVLGIIYVILQTHRFSKKEFFKKDFYSKAKDLLDKGLTDEVIELSETRIQTHPKDKYAHWYLALAYLDKKEYSKSLKTFSYLLELAPAWREEYIEPHIDEIKHMLENTKPEIVSD
jgi:tetratricopeptide (TPR) repeat protein